MKRFKDLAAVRRARGEFVQLKIMGTIEERFNARVVKCESGCWEWSGHRTKTGYGAFTVSPTKHMIAHRQAWELANGREIPAGMQVLHSCDNPPCVNPAHLRIGTISDNIADAVIRGRCHLLSVAVCRNGHVRTPENTKWARKPGGRRFTRLCRICRRANSARGNKKASIKRAEARLALNPLPSVA